MRHLLQYVRMRYALPLAAICALVACEPTSEDKAEPEPPDRFVQATVEEEAVEEAEPETPPPAEPIEQTEPIEESESEAATEDAEEQAAEALGSGSIEQIFEDQDGFSAKMDVAESEIPSISKKNAEVKGSTGDLQVGSGAGGMGMRGSGKGGGGEGFGRIAGLGSVDTGGGKGTGAKISKKVPRSSGAVQIYESESLGSMWATGTSDSREAPNTEHYADNGTNEMTDTADDALSTFAVDVDTGSYTIARRKLTSGTMPPSNAVRPEEFVNYFRYNYPDPDEGAFGVSLEAAPSPFVAEDDRKVLRIGVQGKRVTKSTRKPVHLTFLVDTSGSMNNPDKIELAKRALGILTNNLNAGDTVALTTYAGEVSKVLSPTGMDKRKRILDAIDALSARGSTNMHGGLESAYKLALETYQKDHVNRVIVLSDGDANVGPSSHDEILKRIRHFVDEGVTLSTIGFGMGNYKDVMMEQLANKGNGNYYYIDSEKEARKVFSEQLDGTLQVIAKDVKIQVDFEPEAVKSYRLIGYENRDIADDDFRDDKVDAGEIGAGHTVTALYEVVLTDDTVDRLATVRVRHKEPQGAKASEQDFALTRADLHDSLQAASEDFQFAAAVAGFAEVLRDSPYAKDISLDLVEELAEGATMKGQKDRREFIDLVRKAKSLQKG